jgi:hypothetical protein
MMRDFIAPIKVAGRLAWQPKQWAISLVAWAVVQNQAAAQETSNVFGDMGNMITKADTGIRGSVIIPIITVAVLVLAGAYFVGQSQWAKGFQKQIVIGGLLVALGGGFVTYLTTK